MELERVSGNVILAPLPPPNWGGLHSVIEAVAPHLLELGFTLIPIVPPSDSEIAKRFVASGIRALEMPLTRPRRSLNPLRHLDFALAFQRDARALSKLAGAEGACAIQVAGVHNIHLAHAASLASIPAVFQIHSDYLPPLARRLLTPIAAKQADVFMVNGASVRAAFPLDGRYPASRIVEFRAPINVERFTFDDAARNRARHRLNVLPDTILIGTVGARTHQKAHDRIVELSRRLAPRNNVKTIIIGPALPTQAREYGRNVIAKAEALGLIGNDSIRWIDAGAEVQTFLPALDVFILPSQAEGMPVAMLEAMAAELPVVASRVGSIADVIKDGKNGYLIAAQPFDIDRLQRIVEDLIEYPQKRRAIGKAGRATALGSFSAASVAQSHADAYNIALGKH